MKGIAFPLLFSVATLAHPTGLWWGTDFCYPTPENTDNQCSQSQKAGFDWSNIDDVDNWAFEGFNFDGFSPSDNCGGSGGKCIAGKLCRDDAYTIKVDAVDAPFSVRTFHLSTSRPTNVLMKYELADGTSCHQVAFSSPEGVDVNNDQCGGARSVEFTLPEESQFDECDLNIHSVAFDCSTGPKPPPMATPSESLVPSMSWSTMPSLHTHSTSVMEEITTDITPMATTSTVFTTQIFTVTKCPPTVTDCPAHSTKVVTSTYGVSTAVWSPPAVTGAGHITTSAIISTPAEPTSSVVPAPCPKLVPMCMNTWLSIPKCDSNSDTACFCPSSEFADKVKSCIHAWGTSEHETQSALSYFAGICAPYVPKNPSIIEIPPMTSHASSVHMPTSSWAPTTPAPAAPSTTLTWSSHTVTVPQVAFSTVTVSSTTSVCLVPGVPTSHRTTLTPATKTTCASHIPTSSKITPLWFFLTLDLKLPWLVCGQVWPC
ncbi:uncharacterized protein N7498_004821 [Penicillium cinerascens]|uniref:CFEM domain-containing protein n=1 Tax=Penicillium cinerascens TaxID=70096 RepID=A0A9W9SZM6_9EURO|nr:uncharacterized protein N7498_004821 [Penicillium cinerascens]KAJ5203942.1 hypothetical protein N7498_004821 [Penicillium cinerascens]